MFGKYGVYVYVVLGILVALGVWWGISRDSESGDSLIATQSVEGLDAEEQELIDTLLQLRAVSLSGTIFSDPAFVLLRDFGTQIVPEPVGRPNPFAPIRFDTLMMQEGAEGEEGAPAGDPPRRPRGGPRPL